MAAAASPIVTFAQLPGQQKLGTLLALAAAVALFAGAWMWSQTPDYRVLYSNVSDRDGGAIIAALQQMNIPYRVSEGGGAILVAGDQVHETRLRLATQGLPKGSVVGFEAMENQKLGVSQFHEQINYQRALEGELARSIQSLAAVQSARVHLAIPKPSVFLRDQLKPSASVLVNLHAGRSLDAAQVNAIVHLVSNSVPELTTKSVSVLDQTGNLLSANTDATPGSGLDPSQLKYIQQLEQSYSARIESLLAPLLGDGNVRAQVTADVDFAEIEQMAESFKPNQNAAEATIRSQQMSEAVSNNGQGAAGVPGALSNQPPGPSSAPISAGAPNATATGASNSSNMRKEATTNYEVDKTIKHTREPVGKIKRLSVAVLVNHRKEKDAKGKVSYKPLAQAELTQIGNLVRDAVGFSKERGDSLNVVNSAFAAAEPEVLPKVPLWKNPDTIILAKDIGKHALIAGLVLYLFLGVIRPTLRRLASSAAPPARVLTDQAGAVVPMLDGVPAASAGAGFEQGLQKTRELAKQDPQLVANVVKTWMGSNER